MDCPRSSSRVPRFPGKTKSLYQAINSNHYTDGRITQHLVESTIKAGAGLGSADLYNAFENVAFDLQPELETARQHILKSAGKAYILLAQVPPCLSYARTRSG